MPFLSVPSHVKFKMTSVVLELSVLQNKIQEGGLFSLFVAAQRHIQLGRKSSPSSTRQLPCDMHLFLIHFHPDFQASLLDDGLIGRGKKGFHECPTRTKYSFQIIPFAYCFLHIFTLCDCYHLITIREGNVGRGMQGSKRLLDGDIFQSYASPLLEERQTLKTTLCSSDAAVRSSGNPDGNSTKKLLDQLKIPVAVYCYQIQTMKRAIFRLVSIGMCIVLFTSSASRVYDDDN